MNPSPRRLRIAGAVLSGALLIGGLTGCHGGCRHHCYSSGPVAGVPVVITHVHPYSYPPSQRFGYPSGRRPMLGGGGIIRRRTVISPR